MDLVVSGLGPSVEEFAPHAERYNTIGVNDIGRWFLPDHLLVLDRHRAFSNDRAQIIERTTPRSTHWYYSPWPGWTHSSHPGKQRVRLAVFPPDRVGPALDELRCRTATDMPRLPHYKMSPFAALSLAFMLGAEHIGLVGVDLFGHPRLQKAAASIDVNLFVLAKCMADRGVTVVNLSPRSALESLPRSDLSFIRQRKKLQVDQIPEHELGGSCDAGCR